MSSATIFAALAVFVTVVAVGSYLNHRFLRLPAAIGLMVVVFSILVQGLTITPLLARPWRTPALPRTLVEKAGRLLKRLPRGSREERD